MVSLSGAYGFGRRVATDFSDKNVTFMAAGLAYHAFISLAPMLLLVFVVLSAVGTGLEERVATVAGTWLPGPIADVVTELLQGGSQSTGASIIGLVVLLWGTLKIFRGLDTAFSEIYETVDTNSLLDKFKDGITVFVALVIALVAMIGSGIVLETVAERVPYAETLTPIALILGLMVAFFPIYYVFPDTDVGIRDVLPGVALAAVAWAALQGLFQVYVSVAEPSSGSFFGGVIVVVTYLYFSALVLLLGAVVNAVAGDHSAGEPGGVGRASGGQSTMHEERFDRAGLAAYLWDLRAELMGDAENDLRTEMVDRRPQPSGDVTVVERSKVEDDRNQWTVSLQWEFDDEELAAQREAQRAAADERAGRERSQRDRARPRRADGEGRSGARDAERRDGTDPE